MIKILLPKQKEKFFTVGNPSTLKGQAKSLSKKLLFLFNQSID